MNILPILTRPLAFVCQNIKGILPQQEQNVTTDASAVSDQDVFIKNGTGPSIWTPQAPTWKLGETLKPIPANETSLEVKKDSPSQENQKEKLNPIKELLKGLVFATIQYSYNFYIWLFGKKG